jgi:pilus assembly protein Flp/PilA
MLSWFNHIILALQTRIRNEEGQALAEYGLILGLIAVVCIIALTGIGLAIAGQMDSISVALGG